MIIFSIKIHHNGERGQSQDYDFNMDKVLTFQQTLRYSPAFAPGAGEAVFSSNSVPDYATFARVLQGEFA
jgi:hypothetical protein